MDAPQLVAIVASSSVLGIIITKLFDWTRDAMAGRAQARRKEVDTAIAERDKARAHRDLASKRNRIHEGRERELDEALSIHRRVIIDAPCLGPEHLPERPTLTELPE